MEMDNHMSDKDESCYDNAEAAFSDDEEDVVSLILLQYIDYENSKTIFCRYCNPWARSVQ